MKCTLLEIEINLSGFIYNISLHLLFNSSNNYTSPSTNDTQNAAIPASLRYTIIAFVLIACVLAIVLLVWKHCQDMTQRQGHLADVPTEFINEIVYHLWKFYVTGNSYVRYLNKHFEIDKQMLSCDRLCEYDILQLNIVHY